MILIRRHKVAIVSMVSIVPINGNYNGMSYSEMAKAWMQWLVSPDPDVNMNRGSVVYLRGLDFQLHNNKYVNYVKVGKDAIIIQQGQSLFWPLIMYYMDSYHHPLLNLAQFSTQIFINMQNGDFPPQNFQALFDGKTIINDFNGRHIITPPFPLTITATPYGNTSLASLLDEPWPSGVSGTYQCVVGGYFIWIQEFGDLSGLHSVFTTGNGELGYHTETLVDLMIEEETLPQMKMAGAGGSSRDDKHFKEMDKILEDLKIVGNERKRLDKIIRMGHGMKQRSLAKKAKKEG